MGSMLRLSGSNLQRADTQSADTLLNGIDLVTCILRMTT